MNPEYRHETRAVNNVHLQTGARGFAPAGERRRTASMQRFLLLAGMSASLLSGLGVASEPEAACPVEGDLVHWIADYCMLKAETDDEIAASECISEEIRTMFRTACIAKLHFKRAMCRLVVASEARRGSVEQCLEDPGFRGRTVKNKGVGG